MITSGPGRSVRSGLKSLLDTLDNAGDKSPENLAGKLQEQWATMCSDSSQSGRDVTFSVICQGMETGDRNLSQKLKN
jgi:hypothetical protein